MNFDLDEQQELLEETLLRFFDRDFDLAQVREVFESDDGFDPALWKQLGELGLFGVMAAEDHGGSGLGLLDLVVAADALGYHAAPGPFLEQVVAIAAIQLAGSAEQQQRWLPSLVTGDTRATFAFGEGAEAWLPDRWSVDGPSLTGTKSAVLYPSGADLVVVGTSTGLAVVDGHDPGLTVVAVDPLDRTRRIADLRFDSVAADALPGDADPIFDLASILVAADAAGGARRCLELSVDYANTREQFGVTIGHFQGLKHQIADMAVDVLPLRNLVWYAAHAFDERLPETAKFASLAKSHVTDQYVAAARRTVELHGGIGYTWECDVQFFLKRAVFDRTVLGSPSAHRARAARINQWSAA